MNALDVPLKNATRLSSKDAIKFTVSDEGDLKEAYQIWQMFFNGQLRAQPQIFAGPVFGTIPAEDVAIWIMNNQVPWRLNMQLHKYIWEPEARRT
jgi:7-carboxy-7-deazaguanine synthase